MITVASAVNNIIRRKPFLEEELAKGFLNLSAFARYYRKEIETLTKKTVKTGAIVMAAKRLAKEESAKWKKIKKSGKPRELLVRSDLFELTIRQESSLLMVGKLSSLRKEEDNYFFTITEGIFETTIISSLDIKQKIIKKLGGLVILSEIDNLSSITLRLPESNLYTPGVYYEILKQLYWESINVVEIVSTTNEITLIVFQKDLEYAFSVLKEMYLPHLF